MRKFLLSFFIILLGIATTFALYIPSKDDILLLGQIQSKIVGEYNKDVNKAYFTKTNIENFFIEYEGNEKAIYLLNFINAITDDYIKSYEYELNLEFENKENQNINDMIMSQSGKLKTLDKETKTLAIFSLEPQNESVYLNNVYLENIGNLKDISDLFKELYLVDDKDKIISKGFVHDNYLYFDTSVDVLLKEGVKYDFYVKAILEQPTSRNQIGELKFQLNTPQNSTIGTLNGVRVTSYKTGKFTILKPETNINPIVTLVLYNDTKIVEDETFVPNYSQVLGFRVYNNSKEKLNIERFDIQVLGDFLNNLDENTKFIMRVKGTDGIFATIRLLNMNTESHLLYLTYAGSAFGYVPANSYVDYVLEIEHSGAPTGERKVRLNNVVIGDGFGSKIEYLSKYLDIGVPTKEFYYKY